MKALPQLAGVLIIAPPLPTTAQEGVHPPHWGYAGELGPEHWAQFAGSAEVICRPRCHEDAKHESASTTERGVAALPG